MRIAALALLFVSAAAGAAEVELPERADGRFVVRAGGASVAVRHLALAPADRASRGDESVYLRATAGGATLRARRVDGGFEDFLVFAVAPDAPRVALDVELGAGVAGLRQIGETGYALEFLDEGGAPRLRMAAPELVDAAGAHHAVAVAVAGCAVDRDPRAPWGRPTVAPGARTCRVELSWPANLRYPATLDPAWTATGTMMTSHADCPGGVLPNGLFIIAGGREPEKATTELYDPATGTWAQTGDLAQARRTHFGIFVNRGFLVGGGCANGTCSPGYLPSAEFYDPATGKWSAAGTIISSGVVWPVAALLPGNQVLVAGGVVTNGSGGAATTACEIWDPASNLWTPTGSLTTGRYLHMGLLLPTGKVLVVGGSTSTSGGQTATAELFDPSSGKWSAGASLSNARVQAQLTMLGGRPLLTGGDASTNVSPSLDAWFYNPASDTWSAAGSTAQGHILAQATALPDGRLLLSGGEFGRSDTEIYDPVMNSWSTGPTMVDGRDQHVAAIVNTPSGLAVLAAGGFSESPVFGFTNTAELLTVGGVVSTPDLGAPPDLSHAIDLSAPPDLSHAADLSQPNAPVDLARAADDLAAVDGGATDLADGRETFGGDDGSVVLMRDGGASGRGRVVGGCGCDLARAPGESPAPALFVITLGIGFAFMLRRRRAR